MMIFLLKVLYFGGLLEENDVRKAMLYDFS